MPAKKKKVRRGLLRKLFGTDADKVTIIIPGDSVNEYSNAWEQAI